MRYVPALVLCLLFAGSAKAQLAIQIEPEVGVATTLYNDVAVPGDTGTRISLTEGWSQEAALAPRFRFAILLGGRHELSALAAPLRISGEGTFDEPVDFDEQTFAPVVETESFYRFDSYRVTYRYRLVDRYGLELGAGVTAKVRDAAIELEQLELEGRTTDRGLVPLLSGRLRARLGGPWWLLADAEALVGPDGRAEDVLVAAEYDPAGRFRFYAGLRALEGGADVEQVYNFSLTGYGVVGLIVRLR